MSVRVLSSPGPTARRPAAPFGRLPLLAYVALVFPAGQCCRVLARGASSSRSGCRGPEVDSGLRRIARIGACNAGPAPRPAPRATGPRCSPRRVPGRGPGTRLRRPAPTDCRRSFLIEAPFVNRPFVNRSCVRRVGRGRQGPASPEARRSLPEGSPRRTGSPQKAGSWPSETPRPNGPESAWSSSAIPSTVESSSASEPARAFKLAPAGLERASPERSERSFALPLSGGGVGGGRSHSGTALEPLGSRLDLRC